MTLFINTVVAAVLLRVAWLDARDVDSGAQPPDGELAQVEQGVGAGEGHAVAGADGFWQAAFLEQTLEGGEGKFLTGRIECFAKEEKARGLIGDGEGIAIGMVAAAELALVVGAPQVIGRGAR